MKVALRKLFPLTGFSCEALSVAALFLARELPASLFAGLGALGVLALFLRLGDRWLLTLIGGTVIAGLYAGYTLTMAIGTLVAAPMLAVHGLTWLARDQGRYRYWRIGIAFLEMILAAILAPETHMFFLIFFFVILLSLTLSFGFLEQNFASRDPAGLNRPLRSAYLSAVVVLSFVIFLSSLLIFPILPRKESLDSGPVAGAMPGYSEEVSFQTATFYWTGDESRPVMWLFLPEGARWEEVLPYGLLRGKSLERFDGRTWRAAAKGARAGKGAFSADWQLEILREPMPAEALPVPYGTEGVETNLDFSLPMRLATGEWTQPGGVGRRIDYQAKIARQFVSDQIVIQEERQTPGQGYERLRQLADRLARGAATGQEKARAVLGYFQNGFTADQVPVAAAAEKGPSPVEAFLFESKRGHCELFATATALLLREMGVATRLVVGFRAPIGRSAKVVTVRNGDAHAWVEAWIDGQWRVIDPTPAIAALAPSWQALREAYDWVSAYWHRYILAYQFDAQAIARWALRGGALVTALLLLAGIVRAVRAWRRRLRRGPREEVGALRIALERKLRRSGREFEASLRALPGGLDWVRNYEKLRFGPGIPQGEEILALRRAGRALTTLAARAAPTAPAAHPPGT